MAAADSGDAPVASGQHHVFGAVKLVPAQDEARLDLVPVIIAAIPSRLASQLMRTLNSKSPILDLRHLKRIRRLQGAEGAADSDQLDIILCHLPPPLDPPSACPPAPSSTPAPACAAPAAATGSPQPPPPTEHPSTSLLTAAAPAPVAPVTAAVLPTQLPAAVAQLMQQHQLALRTVLVPAAAPSSRAQWERWSAVWPTNWRVLEGQAALPDQEASHPDQAYFEQWMALALQLAAGAGSRSCAVLVDPATRREVARGADNAARHPLHHPVMVGIEASAAKDRLREAALLGGGGGGGGALLAGAGAAGAVAGASVDGRCGGGAGGAEEDGEGLNGGGAECGRGDTKRQRTASSSSQPADHGGEGAPEATAASPAGPGPSSVAASAATASAGAGAGMGAAAGAAGPGRPYMCTGYDCFVVCEPCVMCAMALVHSRVGRVVYCHPDPRHGALGGSFKLHAQRSLNHHYAVYHLPLGQ